MFLKSKYGIKNNFKMKYWLKINYVYPPWICKPVAAGRCCCSKEAANKLVFEVFVAVWLELDTWLDWGLCVDEEGFDK